MDAVNHRRWEGEMLQYFPDVYWPNLLFSNALSSGASAGDMDDACREAQTLMRGGTSDKAPEFKEALVRGFGAVADKLDHLIFEDRAMGRLISAADKSFRLAAVLNCLELLMDDFYDPRKVQIFDRQRAAFKTAIEFGGEPHDTSRFIEIPFEGTVIDALFTPANRPGPAPVVIHLNGTHSTIEWQYLLGIAPELARRGIASISMDHPGSGTARYHRGLKYRPDSESYVGAVIDHLTRSKLADSDRIGVCGSSFGGYFAPRAAANESRIKACCIWGATYAFPIDRYFPDGRPSSPGPLADAVREEAVRQQRWTHGAKDNLDLYDKMLAYSLKGHIERVTCPLFIIHGINDPQAPMGKQAERTFIEAVASSRAEIIGITPEIGGDMHCNVDNPRTTTNAIGDWFGDIFGTIAQPGAA
ncbi:alpha/beta fold hydrolase [Sphingopyxis sp.]|uniref:alpha/beta hydrolase family protein n=1 Tax=Sphingopyxis sp. TaxID=1908224 RepID=UPI001DC2133D|nr:alpha/beta fold hydrolase [Sphingopyxis sp.]MBW8296360.1 alpha/beta hydrolase [Sphingopyxis sp.]